MDRKYGEYQKILLNLKWFVKQLCRIFEEKLERRCSHEQRWSTTLSMTDRESNDDSDALSNISSTHSSPKHLSWTHSLTNSPLLRRLAVFQQKHQSPIKRFINNNSNNTNNITNNNDDKKIIDKYTKNNSTTSASRLIMLKLSSNRIERELHIRRFGEHLAVIYEYQIGMLNSLQAVSIVVNYVVDLLLKSIKKGVLLGLDPVQLNPTILFDCTVIPKSGSKLVKTVGIGVHSNSLTWKVSNIFTHPGLRHNQVGGEDCTNLSIVTHLLTGFCPFGESRRPDIYGYRNLIVVPRRRLNTKQATNTEEFDYYKDKKSSNIPTAYEISLYDSSTISHARSQSGESTPSTSTNSLLDHIHKCYKSIFFVIFERPNVIEHLMTCQSFRIFCTKELITPVMFLTTFSDLTMTSNHKSLFNNFDLFNICVTAQPKIASNNRFDKNSIYSQAKLSSSSNNNNDNHHHNHNHNDNNNNHNDKYKKSEYIDSQVSTRFTDDPLISREYDNFGFNI